MPKKRPNARKSQRVPKTSPLGVKLSAEQREMQAATRSEIDRTQRELGDEQSRLDALRSQHVASQQAHATAMREHQVLLLARADEDKVAEVDRRIREVEDRISTLSGAIAGKEAKVSQLAAKLADAEVRDAEGKAREADAYAVALEHALGNLKPPVTEFVNACCAAGAVIPQPIAIGRTMADILKHIENDTAFAAELLRQRARALRQEPPPALPASKVTPKPELMPQPQWQSDLLGGFVDWATRVAARVHAKVNRTRSSWQRLPRHINLLERSIDWKARAAARIATEAIRVRSLWQRLFAWR